MPPILNPHKRKRASSSASDDGPPRKLKPSRDPDHPRERTPFGKIQSLKRKMGAITEIEFAPEDWDANESDLHEHDIDGQIERCHERLEANIMPQIFKRRLQAYTIAKQRRDALFESEPNGLSLQVVQRLHDLKAIEKTLEQRDVWKQLPNVQSLMEAYRSKKLVWEEGSVTYWSRGSQICKPKQFKWKDFEEVNRKFDGYKGFWVEGLHDPGPASLNAFITIPPSNPNWHTHTLKIHVRVPTRDIDKQPRPVVLDILDDTGSQFMHLYEDDLDLIHHSAGRFAPSLGVVNGSSAAGWLQLPTVELEAQICSGDDKPMTEWVKVQSTVQQGSVQSNGNHRLSGIWVRHVLYTATAPDNQGELMLSTEKTHLNSLPVVRPAKGISTVTETPARNFVPPTSVGQLSRTGTPQPGEVRAPYVHSIFPGTPLPAETRSFSERQHTTAVEMSGSPSFRGRLQTLFPGASDPRPASPSTIYPRSSESSRSSVSSRLSGSSKSSSSSRSSISPSATSSTLSPNADDDDEEDVMDVDEVEFERDVDVDDEEEEDEEEDGGEGKEEEEESEEEEEMVHHRSDVEDSDSDNEQDEETDDGDSEYSKDEDLVVSGCAGKEGAMGIDDFDNSGSSDSGSDSSDSDSSEESESDNSNSDDVKVKIEDAEEPHNSNSDNSDSDSSDSEDSEDVDIKVNKSDSSDSEDSEDENGKVDESDSSDSEDDGDAQDASGSEYSDNSDDEDSEGEEGDNQNDAEDLGDEDASSGEDLDSEVE